MTKKRCYDECFTGDKECGTPIGRCVPEDNGEDCPMRERAKTILQRLADEYRTKANQVDALASSLADNIPYEADDILWKLAQDAMNKLHKSL